MARTYEISFRLGAQMAGNFAKTMTSASGALGQLNNKIGELSKQQSSIGGLTKLRQEVLESSREYKKARDRVAELGQAMSRTENPTREMTREFNKAERAVTSAKNRLNEKRQTLRELNTQLGTTGVSTKELTRRQEEMAKSAERARSAQASLQKTLNAQQANVARRGELRGQLFDAAAMAVAIGTPIRIAANFEQSMDKVGAVSRATDGELNQLTATARELGATTEWSASQAAQGMEFLSMAGFKTNETISAMPGMLNLASAGAIDLGQAADIASNVLTGFGMEAEKMGALGDVLTNTFTSSNTNLEMLGNTMSYVAPVAASTGVSLEQTAAMAGKLGDAGIQGSKAGTALRAVISRLSAPAGQAAQMLSDLGVKTQDASGDMRDLPTIMSEMDRAMSHMGSGARSEIMSTVFGLEAASAATVLLGQAGSGNLAKYAQSLGETGSAARVAQKQQENAAGAMRRLSSAGESIAITLGNVLLPTLASGAQMLASVVGVVDSLAQTFPLLTTVIVGGTTALIALRVATIAGGYAYTFLKGAVLSVTAVIKTLRVAYLLHTGALTANTAATKGAIVVSKIMAATTKAMTAVQWLFNAALTANPIGLVVVAIAGLIAAGVALYKNWDKVTAFFSAAWQKIKTLFMNFHPLGWIMKGMQAMHNWLSGFSLYGSGVAILKTLASGIKAAVSVPVNAVKGALSRVRQYLPFSDAKVGPLSELTASGESIMKTLSAGMQSVGNNAFMVPFAKTAQNLMDRVRGSGLIGGAMDFIGDTGIASALREMSGSNASRPASGGATIQLSVEQNISVGGGGDTYQQARQGASAGAQDLMQELQRAMDRERRLGYE